MEKRKRKLLFVCTGNTCRSPLASAFVAALLAGWEVESAGLAVYESTGASAHAIAVGAEHGLDLKRHISRQLTPEMLLDADLVLAMTSGHAKSIRDSFPRYAGKVYTLKEFLGQPGDVADPYGGGPDIYRTAARELCGLAEQLAEKLRAADF